MNAKYIAFIIIFLLTVLGVFIAVIVMKSTWFKQFWRSRGKGKVMDAPPSVDEIEMQSDHDFDTNEVFYPTSQQLKQEGRKFFKVPELRLQKVTVQVERHIVDQDYSNIIEMQPTSRPKFQMEETDRGRGIWAELAQIESGRRTIESFLDP